MGGLLPVRGQLTLSTADAAGGLDWLRGTGVFQDGALLFNDGAL